MEKYISKSALVAEIEKLKGKVSDSSSYCNGWQHALRMLELSLDTIEVKEVDLDKPFEGIKVQTSMESGSLDEIILTTKYKAQKRE